VSTTCETTAAFTCFNREGLATLLPHQGSALRKIDGVFLNKANPTFITGMKKIEPGDPDLDGHFPGAPTYPGYAQDEFTCLTAAALVLYLNDGLERNPHVVQKVCRYKRAVSPGDTLRAEVVLKSRRSRFFHFSAEIRNQHEEIVAEYEKIVGVL